MADLRLSAVTKSYGNRTILKDIDLEIKSGECFTILGPSGCGKTVILRLIAGFEKPDSGTVSIGATVVADQHQSIPPEERHIGVVFQDYAVWPHKSVYDNIAYPLEISRTEKRELMTRVDTAIEQVNLVGLAERLPYQLSGGQQQRVALARALVSKPEVMLLDEPLTNLDANLREEMRFEIKDLQVKTGATILYVTHDQEVALAISDRMAVMDSEGRIRQIGTPDEIYERPADAFVYKFLGIPNFMPVRIEGGAALVGADLRLPIAPPASFAGGAATAACRPMDVILHRQSGDPGPGGAAPAAAGTVPGTILRRSLLGPLVDYLVRIGGTELRAQMQTEEAVARNLILDEGAACGVSFHELKWFGPGEAAE